MKEYFIDEHVRIFSGKEASEKLSVENDTSFLTDNDGIVRVSVERWNKAQSAEFTHWMKLGINTVNDRNDSHREGFGCYSDLRNKSFKNAIELGCGPFTNLRIVGKECSIRSCSLLDPLIIEYLNHPHCFFSKKHLYLEPSGRFGHMLNRYSPSIYRTIQRLLGARIAITDLYPLPIEQFNPHEQYDLVLIINVLEHCFDASVIFQKILDLLPSDGVLVFHDKLYASKRVKQETEIAYDAAHPLRIEKKIITSFLEENFVPLHSSLKRKYARLEWIGENYEWEEIYFIGTKR